MELAVYRALWGFPGSGSEALTRIAAAGYDGIEVDLPLQGEEREEIEGGCARTGLALIPQCQLTEATPAGQLDQLRRFLAEAHALGAECLVALSGRDEWPVQESIDFFRSAVAVERDSGVAVAHEIHRGHALVSPWATAEILAAVDELRLCCDFSHWVLACERLLDPARDGLERVAEHAIHLHARVGTEQAPQVRDPAAPEAAEHLAAFEKWWELVWDAQARAGVRVSTVTPEYGAPPYQPVPLGSPGQSEELVRACDWQANRLREKFAARFTQAPGG